MAAELGGDLAAMYQSIPQVHEELHFVSLTHENFMHKIPRPRAEPVLLETYQPAKPPNFQVHMLGHSSFARREKISAQRSVNSFMTFRSYYKPIFPKLQQKDASSFLTTIWKNDPFKAKWTIAAKAYSSIRDVVGKQRASLFAFLTLVCPKIGMVNAEDYFWKMNWKLEAAVDGTKVLKQTSFPDLSYFGADILYTNMTPKDVIHFCAQMCYIPQQVANQIAWGNNINPAGSLPKNQMSQQSLLASCPVAPQLDQSTSLIGEGEAAVGSSPACPPSAGSGLAAISVPLKWTGSMLDLYTPPEGSIDSMFRNPLERCFC